MLSMVFTYFLMKKHMRDHHQSKKIVILEGNGDKDLVIETIGDLLAEVGVNLK
jgi:hypothetical protein